MNNKSSHTDRCVRQEVQRFVQGLLDDGFGAAEISFYLAESSAGLGLDVAPDPEIAIAIILEGIRAACVERSASVQREEEQTEAEHECSAHVTLH